jgi:hypothetical protein
MTDMITKRLEKRNAELQRISESMEKALKKLARLAARIDRLRIERNRLLRPRQLPPEAKLKITGEEYTKIRERDFEDAVPVF